MRQRDRAHQLPAGAAGAAAAGSGTASALAETAALAAVVAAAKATAAEKTKAEAKVAAEAAEAAKAEAVAGGVSKTPSVHRDQTALLHHVQCPAQVHWPTPQNIAYLTGYFLLSQLGVHTTSIQFYGGYYCCRTQRFHGGLA